MESTDKPAPEPEKVAPPPEAPVAEPERVEPPPKAPAADLEKAAPPSEGPAPDPEKAAPPPPEAPAPAPAPPPDYFMVADVVLRVLLLAAAVAAVVVMVTAKETKQVLISPFGVQRIPRTAKFNHSPAFIYFVAALSVAALYSVITVLVSFLTILKPGLSTKLLSHFVIFDVLILGIVAAATGAAAGVGYIGLKGNSHVGWTKVCNVYDKFCRHLGASLSVSLFASIVLVLLVILSAYSLSKKIPK